jgi:hypothetical protein
MPVFAALVGVLGGVGGAIAGGSLANRGQEERFLSERQAAIQDLRLDKYGTLVGAADVLLTQFLIVDEYKISKDAKNKLIAPQLLDLQSATATVDLLADTAVRSAADELTTALVNGTITNEQMYDRLRQDFIQEAQVEITNG